MASVLGFGIRVWANLIWFDRARSPVLTKEVRFYKGARPDRVKGFSLTITGREAGLSGQLPARVNFSQMLRVHRLDQIRRRKRPKCLIYIALTLEIRVEHFARSTLPILTRCPSGRKDRVGGFAIRAPPKSGLSVETGFSRKLPQQATLTIRCRLAPGRRSPRLTFLPEALRLARTASQGYRAL
jgi:hypothetical protein